MARLSGTAALFLVLAGVMSTVAHAGWSELAERAGLAGRAALARSAEYEPPGCIACPRPGLPIRWPREFQDRSGTGHR